jgi:hypothetical protein
MSSSSLAGEVIGSALRHAAMFAVWVILVIAVVTAIVIGVRALCRRQESGLRDQTADRQANARFANTRPGLLGAAPWPPPAAAPLSIGAHRAQSASDSSRVPVQRGR